MNDSTSPPVPPRERLLTLAEAAHVLGVSVKTVRRLYEAGDLPVVRVGRSVRVAPEDLQRFIAERRSA